jgi:hypothetical protein
LVRSGCKTAPNVVRLQIKLKKFGAAPLQTTSDANPEKFSAAPLQTAARSQIKKIFNAARLQNEKNWCSPARLVQPLLETKNLVQSDCTLR